MNIKDIENKTIREIKTLTEQYKINILISKMLFEQNHRERQNKILKAVFKNE